MKHRNHLFLSTLALTATIVTSEWEYIPPEYTCSPSISGCSSSTHECLANPNHPQSTTDVECKPCQGEQSYWPCDVDGLCYCWDKSTAKIPPAPSTRLYNGGEGLPVSDVDPCSLVTETVFKNLAPMAQHPYSYEGFCTAVRQYNINHPKEGVFNMGSTEQQKSELAAFFGNALHESDEFKAGREYLMCADRIEMGGEVYCRPCDVSSFDWDSMTCPSGASLASEGRAFNNYCQSNLAPPEGCVCDDVYERASSGPMAGYVKANEVYFGRGSIQLSWNYNYIRASVALTGASQTFCQRPDLVATNEEYAWGAGIFYWMENVKNDKTCHQSVLLQEDFGLTLDNINGGLECPADDHGWHGKAVQLRLNRYCRAATALGVKNLLKLDGCMDMEKRMKQCLEEGTCKDCRDWEDSLQLGDVEVTASEHDAEGGGDTDVGDECSKKKNPEKCRQQFEAAKQAAAEAASNNNSNGEDSGCKYKNKEKCKAEEAAKQAAATSSNSSGKNKDKNKQQQQQQGAAKEEAGSNASTQDMSPAEERPVSSSPPTAQPSKPADQEVLAAEQTLLHKGACTGRLCPIAAQLAEAGINMCRSSGGICGAGPEYCNEVSTWTLSCLDKSDGVGSTASTTVEASASSGATVETNDSDALARPLRTKFPTPSPSTSKPTEKVVSASSSFASSFGTISTPANPVPKPQPKPQSSPSSSSSSAASSFATHSKGRNNPEAAKQAAVSRPMPATNQAPTEPVVAMSASTSTKSSEVADSSPASSETKSGLSSAAQFGSMTNWANTKLEYPPTYSPIASPADAVDTDMLDVAFTSHPTPLPTKLPTEPPVKVINIAEVWESPSSDSSNNDDGNDAEMGDMMMQSNIATSLVNNELPQPIDYYTQLADGSYVFSPMDDVTISRSNPATNYGSDRAIVVDMLEGDATLLRFDLSVLGDNTIEKATLKLTSHNNDEESDGNVNHAGRVYYIQPVVNGWTESSVTYDTVPKAEGALFASVMSSHTDDELHYFDKFELDVTEAMANHIISFKIMGTDRVRSEFVSKEGIPRDDAPTLLVTLESSPGVVADAKPESSDSGTTLHSKEEGPSKGKQQSKPAAAASSSSSSSFQGTISGHIWHDKNDDGIRDTAEPGLRGILVDLYQCAGDTWVEGTRTASGGDYIFRELPEGEYYVMVTASSEYGFSDQGYDSNVDPATGRGDCVELCSWSGCQRTAAVNAGIGKKLSPSGSEDSVPEVQTEVEEEEGDEDYNCRGKPCLEGTEYCRSKYNYCGVGDEYCNEESRWTIDCGMPEPTYQPSATPTTGMPTFLHDPDIHCAGEPCLGEVGDDGTWCRSEIGYCGAGPLYCNPESMWVPLCNGGTVDGSSNVVEEATTLKDIQMGFHTAAPTEAPVVVTESPTLTALPTTPTKKDLEGYSSFALPTLSQIVFPKQTDIMSASHGKWEAEHKKKEESSKDGVATSDKSSSASKTDEDDQESQPANNKEQNGNADDSHWYVRYSDVRPIRNWAGHSGVVPWHFILPFSYLLGLFLQ